MKRSERIRAEKQRRRGPLFGVALIFLLLCMAVAALGTAWGLDKVTRDAAQKFGSPGQGLSFTNKVLFSWRLLSAEESLLTPLDPAGGPRKFTIQSGDSPAVVGGKLQANGLVKGGNSFLDFLIYSGLDSHLQAGDYLLSPSSSPVEIARKISDANQTTLKFGFLPGWRAEEVGALLEESGLTVDASMFISQVQDPPEEIIPAGLGGISTLEGFLFPGVYELERSSGTTELLQAMLRSFDEQLTPEIRQAYVGQGLTLQEAVTMASMVQKEAVVEEEQPLIASVFLNRMAAGMKYESDPTVQYALGFNREMNTWWKNPLTLEDLETDSPYNTYLYSGFPPGPICNPGLPALRSVAFPVDSPYYYFRARCDGSGRHLFAVSLDEHIQNACP